MKKLQERERKESINKLFTVGKVMLALALITGIYLLSPRITENIQLMAKYLYEMESTYITRVVELILSVTGVIAYFLGKERLS